MKIPKAQLWRMVSILAKISFWLALLLLYLFLVKHTYAETSVYQKPPTLIETIAPPEYAKIIYELSLKHGIDRERWEKVIKCESNFMNVQSNHLYSFSDPKRGIVKGDREMSYGLVQIHLPDNEVTKEQALDPAFSLNWMAEELAQGKWSKWSCNNLI